jgi:hypothetical protein
MHFLCHISVVIDQIKSDLMRRKKSSSSDYPCLVMFEAAIAFYKLFYDYYGTPLYLTFGDFLEDSLLKKNIDDSFQLIETIGTIDKLSARYFHFKISLLDSAVVIPS